MDSQTRDQLIKEITTDIATSASSLADTMAFADGDISDEKRRQANRDIGIYRDQIGSYSHLLVQLSFNPSLQEFTDVVNAQVSSLSESDKKFLWGQMSAEKDVLNFIAFHYKVTPTQSDENEVSH